MTRRILTVNGGSSSLKSVVYEVAGQAPRRTYAASVQRIGTGTARFTVLAADGRVLADRQERLPDLAAAVRRWLDWLRDRDDVTSVDAVGHRIVDGGPDGDRPKRLTPALIDALRRLVPLDPDHLPGQLAAVAAVEEAYPGVPQVGCFDTTFHRTLPPYARRYPLPRALAARGIERYGFHGLSYEYILSVLRGEDAAAARGRILIAHLGGGASMAAVAGGVSVDTTMGLTPAGGLMMGTRCGDIDPGVLVRLLQLDNLTADGLNDLVNHRAGLLGVSETSADMHELLARAATDPRADEAVTLFCYIARKWLGALLAVLGGADLVVFTGGIGEHAPRVRAAICEGLAFAGIRIDAARNEANAPVISVEGQPVAVRVIATNEEVMIARHTLAVLGENEDGR
ncbi:MAG TPA: acetate/propionate family kinase [Vicinamibacterales bacterium]|nr:acetate/propionate family kinase [Vicinamibacterales bacterium]